jgi:hypothetical protein
VANHLQFKEYSSVQFFEVNIRILGGLLSAYFLSDGDDMYLHKAQQLGDRWVLRSAAFISLSTAASWIGVRVQQHKQEQQQ